MDAIGCTCLGQTKVQLDQHHQLQQKETDLATSVVTNTREEDSLLPYSSNKECKTPEENLENREMSHLARNDCVIDTTKDQKKNGFECGKYGNCLRPFFSLLLSAFGACVMAVASVMVKKLTSTSVFSIIMIRFIVMLSISICILYFRCEKITYRSKMFTFI